MIFKRYQERILIRVLLMFLTLSVASFFLVKGMYEKLVIVLPFIVGQLVDFYNFHRKAQQEVEQFVESIHYRDFSRYFDVKEAPVELQSLREGFNEINSTFKLVSREKETQYQYLQKILELVNTGILSYEHKSGEIGWMNEAFKNMLGVPYLKTIGSLERRDANLYQEILSLRPGESRVVSITKDKHVFKTLLAATAFQTDGRVYKLVAFQDVNEALDETEAKAWQKLLSVMTHEIMNSVAPISSLAETMLHRLQESARLLGQAGALEDLELGIGTIRRRSEGLLKFAETYRNLNKITTLNLKRIFARDLFENLHHLMLPTLDQKNIEMDILLMDPDLSLEADTNLIEQVLINLVVNAIEAVKDREEPVITLSAYAGPSGRPVIKVSDNGMGMSPEVMDNIFIPFFSTKKNGSGIGLSLCKQILLLHRGNIQVQSAEGVGSSFLLHF